MAKDPPSILILYLFINHLRGSSEGLEEEGGGGVAP
jgi:hypothetical protein